MFSGSHILLCINTATNRKLEVKYDVAKMGSKIFLSLLRDEYL